MDYFNMVLLGSHPGRAREVRRNGQAVGAMPENTEPRAFDPFANRCAQIVV